MDHYTTTLAAVVLAVYSLAVLRRMRRRECATVEAPPDWSGTVEELNAAVRESLGEIYLGSDEVLFSRDGGLINRVIVDEDHNHAD